MPIQRPDSDTEDDTIGELPSLLPTAKPKRVASEAQLKALELGRQRKAELKEQRAKERQESLVLAQQVKKIKDPASKEVIKNEVIKANVIRQKKPQQTFPVPPPELEEPDTPVQTTRKKQPKIVVEESEPEVIFVKRPKKKIVVEDSETTESEFEAPKPKSKPRRQRRPRQPVETDDSESDYAPPPPTLQRFPRQIPQGFKINF